MLVQFPQGGDGLDHQFTTKRVERLWSIELYDTNLPNYLEDDIIILVGRHVLTWSE